MTADTMSAPSKHATDTNEAEQQQCDAAAVHQSPKTTMTTAAFCSSAADMRKKKNQRSIAINNTDHCMNHVVMDGNGIHDSSSDHLGNDKNDISSTSSSNDSSNNRGNDNESESPTKKQRHHRYDDCNSNSSSNSNAALGPQLPLLLESQSPSPTSSSSCSQFQFQFQLRSQLLQPKNNNLENDCMDSTSTGTIHDKDIDAILMPPPPPKESKSQTKTIIPPALSNALIKNKNDSFNDYDAPIGNTDHTDVEPNISTSTGSGTGTGTGDGSGPGSCCNENGSQIDKGSNRNDAHARLSSNPHSHLYPNLSPSCSSSHQSASASGTSIEQPQIPDGRTIEMASAKRMRTRPRSNAIDYTHDYESQYRYGVLMGNTGVTSLQDECDGTGIDINAGDDDNDDDNNGAGTGISIGAIDDGGNQNNDYDDCDNGGGKDLGEVCVGEDDNNVNAHKNDNNNVNRMNTNSKTPHAAANGNENGTENGLDHHHAHGMNIHSTHAEHNQLPLMDEVDHPKYDCKAEVKKSSPAGGFDTDVRNTCMGIEPCIDIDTNSVNHSDDCGALGRVQSQQALSCHDDNEASGAFQDSCAGMTHTHDVHHSDRTFHDGCREYNTNSADVGNANRGKGNDDCGMEADVEGTVLRQVHDDDGRVEGRGNEHEHVHEHAQDLEQRHHDPADQENRHSHHGEGDHSHPHSLSQENENEHEHEFDKPTITTRFSDIIGHGAAKLRLDEMLLPLALPQSLANEILTGVRAVPASILLYGPPGCGKTQLAKAVAGEAQAAFLSIGPSDVLSKFVGESEASIKSLFEKAKRMARRMESRCTVLFFDEIDALGMSRGDNGTDAGVGGGGGSENSSRRILAELLIQLTHLSDDMKMERDENEDGKNHGHDVSHHEIDDRVTANHYDGKVNAENFPRDEEKGKHEYCQHHNHTFTNERKNGDDLPIDGTSCPARPISPDTSDDKNISKGTLNENKNVTEEICTNSFLKLHNISPISDLKPRIIVIAATNRPEDCDPALLRRFAIRVLIGLPSQRDRRKILTALLEGVESKITSNELKELSIAMEGWSGSDLESVTREAVMAPIRECLRSAAIMKMKMRKKAGAKKKNNVNSAKDDDQVARRASREMADADELARDELLNRFQKLRPVIMQDFEEAIDFWIGDGQEQMTAHMMNQASTCHYDSDSSADETN